MTAAVCWFMKSTYHRWIIPLSSSYQVSAGYWQWRRPIFADTFIEEHLPWGNYSTSKQQFAGRWLWWRPLFAGPWEGLGRHSRPTQYGPCQPSFETRHNTAPPIHEKNYCQLLQKSVLQIQYTSIRIWIVAVKAGTGNYGAGTFLFLHLPEH